MKEDPREALLKYAKVAESDPYWISPAYSQTQPKVSSFTISHLLSFMLIIICFFLKPIFQENTTKADDEEDDHYASVPWKKPKTDAK